MLLYHASVLVNVFGRSEYICGNVDAVSVGMYVH
jgi:hypothetical protein